MIDFDDPFRIDDHETRELPLGQLRPAPWNARRHYDPVALNALAYDLQANGQAQPIVVRAVDDEQYEVIAGTRRLHAARLARFDTLTAIVKELDDQDARHLSLSENLHRQDLNPYEETIAILDLLALELSAGTRWENLVHDRGSEHAAVTWVIRRCARSTAPVDPEAARRVGMAPEDVNDILSWVFDKRPGRTIASFTRNRLPLLNLPDDVKHALTAGELDYTKALSIGRVKDTPARDALLKRAVTEELSYNTISELVNTARIPTTKPASHQSHVRKLHRTVSRYLRYYYTLDGNRRRRVDRLLQEAADVLQNGVRHQ